MAERFAASYVVGEKRLRWPEELIPLVEDSNELVRQAARRSLVILSFLERNPEEARLLAAANADRPPTPLAQLLPPVDFGPRPGANRERRQTAARQWAEWWARHEPGQSELTTRAATPRKPEVSLANDVQQLSQAVLAADPARRLELLRGYRDASGVRYTEALAAAIPALDGPTRRSARELFAERLSRLADRSLIRYLRDDDAEIRRAAVLALAMRDSKSAARDMLPLLLDPEPSVRLASHAALRSLTGRDFGPTPTANEAEREAAVSQWREYLAATAD